MYFKVGNRVYHKEYGFGTILRIGWTEYTPYPLLVRFDCPNKDLKKDCRNFISSLETLGIFTEKELQKVVKAKKQKNGESKMEQREKESEQQQQKKTIEQEKFKNYKPKENYNIGEKVMYNVSEEAVDVGKITKIIFQGGKKLYEVANERRVQQFEAHELAAEVAQTFSDGADVEQQYAEQVKEEIAENTNCTKNQRNEGKFKVGDRVWSPIYGKGVVERKEFTNYMWYWVKFDNAHELLMAICDTGAKRYAWRKEHELLPENEAPENESETDFKIGYKVMIANQKLETHGKKGVITDIFDNGKLAVSLEGEQFFYFYYPADVKLLTEQSIEKEDRNKYSNAEQPAEQKQEEYVPQVGDVVEYITENKYWKGAIGRVKKICSSTQVDVKFVGRDGLFTVANTCLKPFEYKIKYKKMDDVTEFVCDICGIFDKLKETFVKKNKQYATSDPLANFRTGALLKYHAAGYAEMYEEAKDYQRKHIAHIQNNTINGPKVEESLADNAVYSIIELYMWRKQHDKNNSK